MHAYNEKEETPIEKFKFLTVLKHIVSALDECHKKDIVYNNIRQEGIRANSTTTHGGCNWVLFDFSYSIKLVDNKTDKQDLLFDFAKDGFYAPEVIDERQILAKPSDIWSLGILAYQFAFGPCLKDADKMVQGFYELKQNDLDSIIDLLDYEEIVKNFIKRCLRINMDERPTIQEVINDPILKDGWCKNKWEEKPIE